MVAEALQCTPTQIFKRQWSDYQVILQEDYLQHKGLYSAVQRYLQQRAALTGPLRLLDLGCGDSDYISRIIEKAGGRILVASYTGVDLSEPALEVSRQNIARCLGGDADASWHCNDFLTFTEKNVGDFDIVLMSFALHHLSQPDKQTLISNARRMLQNRRGSFVVVDIMRLPGETLSEYQVRSQADVRDNWIRFTPDVQQSFSSHMLQYDFPETIQTFEEFAKVAGFPHMRTLHMGSKQLAQAICLEP